MMRFMPLLLALLWVFPAWAGNWGMLRGETCFGDEGSVEGGKTVCYDPTATDDDSTILSVGAVENFDVFYHEDKDGDATDCTVSITLEHCPAPQRSGLSGLTEAEADNACETLAGTTALSSSNRVESNLAGTFIRLNVAASGSNPTDCRVLLKGALRGN